MFPGQVKDRRPRDDWRRQPDRVTCRTSLRYAVGNTALPRARSSLETRATAIVADVLGSSTMAAREAWLRDGYAILPQIVPTHLLPALRAAAEAVCSVAEATLPDAECQLDPSALVMKHAELRGPVRELAGFALHGKTLGVASELLGVGSDGGACTLSSGAFDDDPWPPGEHSFRAASWWPPFVGRAHSVWPMWLPFVGRVHSVWPPGGRPAYPPRARPSGSSLRGSKAAARAARPWTCAAEQREKQG